MVGGIPLYLRQFEDGVPLDRSIHSVFLDPGSLLYEEPANLLMQEVSKPAPYNAVLEAIAGGASQHNEIAGKAGIASSTLDYYLKELMRIGLVRREVPIVRSGSRKAIWVLEDCLFRFWYRFVRPRRALIERGMGDGVAARIQEELPDYMGPVFEAICADWLWRRLADGTLDVEISDIGRWRGNDPAAREEAEIDIVAVDDGAAVLVGECKWKDDPTGSDQLSKLDRRAQLVGAEAEVPRYLFSRSGFTDGCRSLAHKMHRAHLMSFEDMLRSA